MRGRVYWLMERVVAELTAREGATHDQLMKTELTFGDDVVHFTHQDERDPKGVCALGALFCYPTLLNVYPHIT